MCTYILLKDYFHDIHCLYNYLLTCIIRCLDIYEYDRTRRDKESERVQALRLAKRIAALAAIDNAASLPRKQEYAPAISSTISFNSTASKPNYHSSLLPESLVRSLVAIGCHYNPEKVKWIILTSGNSGKKKVGKRYGIFTSVG